MESSTVHTCNARKPGQPLPFGRPDPKGRCARCKELAAGAPARSAPAWVEDQQRRDRFAADRRRAADEHFAPNGPHARGTCGSVCTKFDS